MAEDGIIRYDYLPWAVKWCCEALLNIVARHARCHELQLVTYAVMCQGCSPDTVYSKCKRVWQIKQYKVLSIDRKRFIDSFINLNVRNCIKHPFQWKFPNVRDAHLILQSWGDLCCSGCRRHAWRWYMTRAWCLQQSVSTIVHYRPLLMDEHITLSWLRAQHPQLVHPHSNCIAMRAPRCCKLTASTAHVNCAGTKRISSCSSSM